MKYIFSSLLILFISFFAFSQNAKIDSLLSLLKKENADSTAINARTELGMQLMIVGEYDRSDSINNVVIRKVEQLLSSTAISKETRLSISKSQARANNTLGIINYYKGDYDKSLKFFFRAMAIREQIGDKKGISVAYNSIGNIQMEQREIAKALESYLKAAKIAEEIQDKDLMSKVYNNIGLLYQDDKDFDKGFSYLQKSMRLREELGNKKDIAASYVNIGRAYILKKDYVKAEEYCLKALKMLETMDDKMAMAIVYNIICNVYLQEHRVVEAKKMQLTSLSLAKELNAKPSMQESYALLAACDSALGDFKEAFQYQKMYNVYHDSIFNESSDKRTKEMQAKFDTEKKEQEIALLTKDSELRKSQVKTQKIIIWSVIGGLLIVIVFAFIIFNRLTVTRKQKVIIEEQKIIVDEKNKHITDSINYAKRIQDAILPSREELLVHFPEHFVFFRPKDIVSGDFYWYYPIPNISGSEYSEGVIFAVVDCTGHGVPGAFMSMIGSTLLNKIVNEEKIYEPAKILDHLQEDIVDALHQESRSQDDGMDISICLFNKEKTKITFAGANHSMFIFHENSDREIKGDIYSIGNMFGKKSVSFSQQEISVEKNSSLFFTTDGFPDQIGGDKGKKFLFRQLEKLLHEVSALGIQEQEEAITKAFDEWKGKRAQLDDVLLTGIKT